MDEWFRSAFGSEYLSLYAHRDESEAERAARLLCNAAGLKPGDLVLDIPCGAGRHARAFTHLQMRVFAADLSGDLITTARQNAQAGAPSPTYVRCDMRQLPFAGPFRLVANLFSSFGYFPHDETNTAVLADMVRVCGAGGCIAMDFMNAARVREQLEPTSQRQVGENRVHERRWIEGSPPRVNKTTRIEEPNGTVREYRESVRLYEPAELRQLFRAAGLSIEHEFGNYAGDAFDAASPRIILVGRK